MAKVLFLLIAINVLPFSLIAQGSESFFPLPVMGVVISENCDVYSEKNLAKKIGNLKMGDTVVIVKWKPHFVFIQSLVKRISGYSNYTQFDLPEDVANAISVGTAQFEEDQRQQSDKEAFEKNQKNNLAAQKDLLQKRDFYDQRFGKEISRQIIAHKYWVGMTKSMAKYSLGKPNTINKSLVASIAKEEWIYKDGPTLFFSEDLLENFKDH